MHNALIAAGMSQSGPIQRASLDEGAEHRLQVRLEGGLCHTLVVLGSGTVRDVDIRVRNEGGEEVATDATDDPQAAVRVCPEDTSDFQVVVRMARGRGAFVLSSWSGVSTHGTAASASTVGGEARGVGTCADPLPLELGRPVAGDTRRGRSKLQGTCGRGSATEQVYRLELAERSQVSVRLQSTFDAVVYLLDGCEDDPSEKACNDDAERGETGRSELDVTVDAGTWFVVVDGYRDEAGDYELIVSSSELPPIADVCRDASELRPGQPTSGTTTGAPDQFQASCAGGSQSPDRVYRIEVPQRSRLRVRQETDHDGSLYLRADCEEPQSELVCNDDHVDPQHAVVTHVVDEGSRFLFSDGFSGRDQPSAGNFSLTAELEPATGSGIAGDGCADAREAPVGQPAQVDTFAARDDMAGSCGGEGAPDAVFRVDVQRRSRLRAHVHASEFAGVMYLRHRCDAPDSEAACVEIPRAAPRDRMATLDAVVERGAHYLVVDGTGEHAFGEAGLELELAELGKIERDCKTAPVLQSGRPTSGTTADQDDTFQAGCAQVEGGRDRVYRLRVRRRSKVTLQLTSDYDGVLHLRGDCVERPSELACNDDHGDNRHSRIERALDRGQYYVIVDGFRSDQSGEFTLETSIDPL